MLLPSAYQGDIPAGVLLMAFAMVLHLLGMSFVVSAHYTNFSELNVFN